MALYTPSDRFKCYFAHSSSRAFSPPTRPDSAITSSQHVPRYPSLTLQLCRQPFDEPTSSSATSASDRSTRSYNIFDVDTYRIESAGRTLLALLLPHPDQSQLVATLDAQPTTTPAASRVPLSPSLPLRPSASSLMLSTLPLTLPKHITSLTLAEIKELAMSLKLYSQSSNKAFIHTLVVLGTFLYVEAVVHRAW